MKVSATDLDFLSGFLKKNSGMIITPEKAYLVEARLGKLARDEGHDSLTPSCPSSGAGTRSWSSKSSRP